MGLIRRTIAALVIVAATVPIVVAPVAAATAVAAGVPAWACAPGAANAKHASTARQVSGRDGVVREPVLDQTAAPLPKSARGKAGADFAATVDVYFHVITNGSEGNLTDKMIRDQVSVLNTTFAGREGGAVTGFSFQLAGVTRTDNAKWYGAKAGAEHEFKKALKQGDDSDLNVYSTDGNGYLGWAYYPNITETNQIYLDGIVLNWRSLPDSSTAYAGRYDLGETLTHEAGHWLNLAHTFENGCKDPGDFVDDTPAQASPTSGCPEGRDSCPSAGLDPIHNYMDYSFDSCYTQFTPGQVQRARDAWLLYRAS
jgi:hypothetical protein